MGALAGDPDLHVHDLMRFDKVMHCFTGTVVSKIAMCRYRREAEIDFARFLQMTK